MSADETAGDELRKLVETKSVDVSTRALGLRAYGHALKENAIPLLQVYTTDATPGPDPKAPPLGLVAGDMISMIRNGRPTDRPR
jgi:hypothetical protein